VTRSRRILAPRRLWSEAELQSVRELYANTPTKDIAIKLGRPLSAVYRAADRLGLHKSEEYLASPHACRLRRGDNVGAAYRFKPGQAPPNKGLRRPGYAPGKMADTQFKPGVRTGIAAKNWCPIGTIRTDDEGYLRIKVREGRKGEAYGFGNTKIWPLLNRHVWEQHKGPIPPGHAVVFKDGDRTNTDIDNLELISRRDLMLRNSSQRWGKEMFEVIQLRGALNRKLRSLSEKQNDGSAEPSLRNA
jgi:hypothetical protein